MVAYICIYVYMYICIYVYMYICSELYVHISILWGAFQSHAGSLPPPAARLGGEAIEPGGTDGPPPAEWTSLASDICRWNSP